MTNLHLKIAYWIAVIIIAPAADRGFYKLLHLPPLLGFALVVVLAWNPLGLLLLIPAAWQGIAGWGWPWWLGLIYSALPVVPVLAIDNWRAFRRPPDITLR